MKKFSNFCDIGEIFKALCEALYLLSEKNLSLREIEQSENIKSFRDFLASIQRIARNCTSYEELITSIQNSSLSNTVYIGLLGKILDSLQLLKPSKRRIFVVKTLENALMRTGHLFLIENIHNKWKYLNELIHATSTLELLEVALMGIDSEVINPIATLRQSIGNRLPEEYFAELIAGWLVEDFFLYILEKKGFICSLEGIDKERTIFFSKQRKMGVFDLVCRFKAEEYKFEVQRVGKLSSSIDKKFYKFDLKSHKWKKEKSNNFVVFWIGKNPPKFPKKYLNMSNTIIFIPTFIEKSHFDNERNKLIVPQTTIDKVILSFEDFVKMTADELRNHLCM